MRAIGLQSFEGGPVELDLPVPQVEQGHLLVKVGHSSINGYDVVAAGGMLRDYMEYRFPAVLGKDFAGTVGATGDGVASFTGGDAVFGAVMRDYVGDGSFAEYVAIPESIGLTMIPARPR
jgi:NADPH:quinone reductase-like Zn-dependent oxidoreductase